jgi:hypothetical protein
MPLAVKTTAPTHTWLVAFALWSIVAAVAATILPAPRAPAPLRVFIIVGPVVTFALALRRSATLRQILLGLNLRWLLAAHVIRLAVGAAFIAFGRQGLVPWGFAVHAGLGDMIAGAGALLLAIAYPKLANPTGRSLLLFWNVVGILDFINVQRVIIFEFAGRQDEFVAMQQLPMAFVPYWGVPLLWSIHIYLLWRHFAPAPGGTLAPRS